MGYETLIWNSARRITGLTGFNNTALYSVDMVEWHEFCIETSCMWIDFQWIWRTNRWVEKHLKHRCHVFRKGKGKIWLCWNEICKMHKNFRGAAETIAWNSCSGCMDCSTLLLIFDWQVERNLELKQLTNTVLFPQARFQSDYLFHAIII
jgi:hypothetical protein